MSPNVVILLWISYQETGEYTRNRAKPFPGDNLETRPFSYIVVSPQSHDYSLSPGN